MKKFTISALAILAMLALPVIADEAPVQQEKEFGQWYFSPGIGWINFEGDEGVVDGMYITGRLGYECSENWSIEASIVFAPDLSENTKDGKSFSKGDKGFDDTYLTQFYIDGLYHFSRLERFDPYLTAGVGLSVYGKDIAGDDATSLSLRAGGGFMYHLSDSWSLRADTRMNIACYNYEFNMTADIGLVWRWGAGKATAQDPAFALPVDSDGDGISDDDEINIYKTNPNAADSDNDGISDGEEVKKNGTDPLKSDFDGDGLIDGDEINKYKTDPRNKDTDGDGVNDGEEVFKTKTNPLSADTEDDGLTDGEETNTYKTNPLLKDTDGDGISDGDEVKKYKTNPLKADTDSDGISDIDEIQNTGTDPLKADTDGDGLNDGEEINKYKTSPVVADTDNDGLNDGDEVKKHKTDPINPDTDYDFLSDGAEIIDYKTDPLIADTDKGGVRDGHEVIYDKTNPADNADDVLMFELNINFDTDTAVIKPEFFAIIDKVATAMLENPEAKATIEGHADKRATSDRAHNDALSTNRAKAIFEYLVAKGVPAENLKYVGYGFRHPKVENDPVEGSVENRRVEVYITGINGKDKYTDK
jgi:outer membrane protein OmpA-like peptidoglycan-associated protein/opacity protein-like surface antigen